MSFCICGDGLSGQAVPVHGAADVPYTRRSVDGKLPAGCTGLRAKPLFEVCYEY